MKPKFKLNVIVQLMFGFLFNYILDNMDSTNIYTHIPHLFYHFTIGFLLLWEVFRAAVVCNNIVKISVSISELYFFFVF